MSRATGESLSATVWFWQTRQRSSADSALTRASSAGSAVVCATANDEAASHDFCVELHQQRGVCDATWASVVQRFGETGAVDLIGINGYYALLSMVMNAARTPAPDSSAPPLRWLAAD